MNTSIYSVNVIIQYCHSKERKKEKKHQNNNNTTYCISDYWEYICILHQSDNFSLFDDVNNFHTRSFWSINNFHWKEEEKKEMSSFAKNIILYSKWQIVSINEMSITFLLCYYFNLLRYEYNEWLIAKKEKRNVFCESH